MENLGVFHSNGLELPALTYIFSCVSNFGTHPIEEEYLMSTLTIIVSRIFAFKFLFFSGWFPVN